MWSNGAVFNDLEQPVTQLTHLASYAADYAVESHYSTVLLPDILFLWAILTVRALVVIVSILD